MSSSRYLKILSLLAILSILLSACGNSSTEGDIPSGDSGESPTSMVMTVWGSQLDPEVYQARLDLYTASHPKSTPVELLYIPSDYSQKVQTMIAGGTSPCIIQVAEDVHGYSGRDQIIPLDDYITSAGIDLEARYGTAGLIQAYRYQGNLYAMPDRGGALILYYNKAMFDNAGLSYPTGDWTWVEFLNAAQALTVRDGETVEVYGFAAGTWWPWWMSFIYMNDGAILDESGTPVFNSAETIEALQFYRDLVYTYKVAPSEEDYANMGQSSPDPLFAQGKAAMSMTGFWAVNSLSRIRGLSWDIAPLFQNKKPATVLFGSGLAITSDCPTPDEAFQVIEFLTSVEGQMPIVSMKQDAPANIELLRSDAFLTTDWAGDHEINLQALVDSVDRAFPLPLSPKWNEMLNLMDDNLAEFFLNLTDAQSSVDIIQEQLVDLFAP